MFVCCICQLAAAIIVCCLDSCNAGMQLQQWGTLHITPQACLPRDVYAKPDTTSQPMNIISAVRQPMSSGCVERCCSPSLDSDVSSWRCCGAAVTSIDSTESHAFARGRRLYGSLHRLTDPVMDRGKSMWLPSCCLVCPAGPAQVVTARLSKLNLSAVYMTCCSICTHREMLFESTPYFIICWHPHSQARRCEVSWTSTRDNCSTARHNRTAYKGYSRCTNMNTEHVINHQKTVHACE